MQSTKVAAFTVSLSKGLRLTPRPPAQPSEFLAIPPDILPQAGHRFPGGFADGKDANDLLLHPPVSLGNCRIGFQFGSDKTSTFIPASAISRGMKVTQEYATSVGLTAFITSPFLASTNAPAP